MMETAIEVTINNASGIEKDVLDSKGFRTLCRLIVIVSWPYYTLPFIFYKIIYRFKALRLWWLRRKINKILKKGKNKL